MEQEAETSESQDPGGETGRELLTELHGFLSLEAPALIPWLESLAADSGSAAGSIGDLEAALVAEIETLYRPSEDLAGEPLYPSVDHRRAVDWRRRDLQTLVDGFFQRRRIRESISPAERLEMLRAMLLTRAVDARLKSAFGDSSVEWQGYVSPQKGFRSTGQEAIVGAALRLRRPGRGATAVESPAGDVADYDGDVISPLIRDLGALLMFMPDPLHPLLVQAGKLGTPVDGRDLHTGDFGRGVLPPAAPLAVAAQTLVGVAYGFKLRRQDRVCVAFIGDGGSSLGEWHEAVNFAAVQRLNIVFVIENNQWALGTHVSEQTACHRFALKGAGYGIPGVTLFGNDPDEVAAGVSWAAERARQGEGPALVELVTYRRAGHAHHDDDRFHGSDAARVAGYEFDDEAETWRAHDPVDLYCDRLQRLGLVTSEEIEAITAEVESDVASAVEAARQAPWPEPRDTLDSVEAERATPPAEPPDEPGSLKKMSYDEAVRQALIETMEEDREVFVLGEDVGGRYGGAFGVTRGLAKRFGAERCLNTPLAESAIVGCAVGAAILGFKPVVEMQFADFLAPGFNALVNNAAKVHWRWGRPVPMVVRLPYGGATGDHKRLLGGGPFHSQCPEMWFVRTPGWKIVAPSTPADAKGLMIAAIRDPNPVIFLESKGLYGYFRTDLRQEVPLGSEHEVPIGEAVVRRPGTDLSIVTYGAMTWTALAAAETLASEGVDAEVVDLRTLWPLDEETLFDSVRKTHRVLLLHEDTLRGGLGGEVAARLADSLFYHLDAPIRRLAPPDTPVPYSPPLEHHFLPTAQRVVDEARRLARE